MKPKKIKEPTYDSLVDSGIFMTNPHENYGFDGLLWETYGIDQAKVFALPENRVATVMECDGKMYLISGRHWVDRFGYFVGKDVLPSFNVKIY